MANGTPYETSKNCPYHVDHTSRIKSLERVEEQQWDIIGKKAPSALVYAIITAFVTVLVAAWVTFDSNMSNMNRNVSDMNQKVSGVKQDIEIIKAIMQNEKKDR